MVTNKRPGDGISPDEIDTLIGKKTLTDIKEDTQIRWEDIN